MTPRRTVLALTAAALLAAATSTADAAGYGLTVTADSTACIHTQQPTITVCPGHGTTARPRWIYAAAGRCTTYTDLISGRQTLCPRTGLWERSDYTRATTVRVTR